MTGDSAQNKKTTLIVDDESKIMLLLRSVLENAGYRTICATKSVIKQDTLPLCSGHLQ